MSIKSFIKRILKKLGFLGFMSKAFYGVTMLCLNFKSNYDSCFRKTAIILLYHRVDDVKKDPQHLCVSLTNFDLHMRFLSESYECINLSELISRIKTNSLVGGEAVVTFDDGYLDNLNNALPILEKYNIPATIFISTSSLDFQGMHSWDMEYQPHERGCYLNRAQIIEVSKHPLLEIGGHTHNHFRLSDLSMYDKIDQIQKNKIILERIIKKRITTFAYPFGRALDFDRESLIAVRQQGYESAVKNMPGFVTAGSSTFSLPRFNVRNCSVQELKAILFNNN
jgi:peptidoglycan/xylan/chitin deacetylase (PgdA/CDA1 family)